MSSSTIRETDDRRDRGRSRTLATPAIVVVDALLVVLFATIGRSFHQDGLTAGGVWSTAWVFLVGLAVGWGIALAVSALKAAPLSLRTGLVIWVPTLAIGLVLYGLRAGHVPHWSFMVVAGTVTAVFLLGWRLVAGRVFAT